MTPQRPKEISASWKSGAVHNCQFPNLSEEMALVQSQNPNQGHNTRSIQQTPVTVVMVPLPAQGHLNPLLHLSCLISSHNIPVYYIGLATHIRQQRFASKVGILLSFLTSIFTNFLSLVTKLLRPIQTPGQNSPFNSCHCLMHRSNFASQFMHFWSNFQEKQKDW